MSRFKVEPFTIKISDLTTGVDYEVTQKQWDAGQLLIKLFGPENTDFRLIKYLRHQFSMSLLDSKILVEALLENHYDTEKRNPNDVLP